MGAVDVQSYSRNVSMHIKYPKYIMCAEELTETIM